MSDVFGIVEQTDTNEFRIQYLITGVQQVVRVDKDKEQFFSAATIFNKRPLACPFLRESEDGYALCTVHETRPDLCRGYFCSQ
jgi:Fe-S-cluster containining protein